MEIITADSLVPFRHGFFTRRGGASSGVFSGLNCGIGSSDQTEAVHINRDRVADAMQAETLQYVHQIHSVDVVHVAEPNGVPVPQADAMVSATPGTCLAILTADCQPVLFGDSVNGVIGAAHAGWKGAIGGILENTVEAMVKLGAIRENITAVIGPSISQAAYEVGPEFFETFVDEDAENARFFANGHGDKYLFDLPAYGLARVTRIWNQ